MRAELEQQLRSRYPKIFADWDKPLSESGMSFGLQCGDGWFDIIDELCRSLQRLTDEKGAPQIVAFQVKQKFGTLRFHATDDLEEEQVEILDNAMTLSSTTCELCGSPGKTLEIKRWRVTTRCEAHASE